MVIAAISVAKIHNKDSEWVIERLHQIGFDVERKDLKAVAMFREVLDEKKVDDGKEDGKHDRKGGAAGICGYQHQMLTILLTLSFVVVVNM